MNKKNSYIFKFQFKHSSSIHIHMHQYTYYYTLFIIWDNDYKILKKIKDSTSTCKECKGISSC